MQTEQLLDLLSDSKVTLGEIVQHDVLFSVFPELMDVPVTLREASDDNEYASYDKVLHRININRGALNRIGTDVDVETSLIHEIQHAAQAMEGIDSGTNLQIAAVQLFNEAYAAAMQDEGFRTLSKSDKRTRVVQAFLDMLSSAGLPCPHTPVTVPCTTDTGTRVLAHAARLGSLLRPPLSNRFPYCFHSPFVLKLRCASWCDNCFFCRILSYSVE